MSAEIVPLKVYNFRLPAAMLRKLADEIEKGEHGENPEIAIVLLGKSLGLYAAGDAFGDLAVATGGSALLYTAALRQLTDHIVAYSE